MQKFSCKIVFISLCIVNLSSLCDSRALRKRTVSEVQLMHNLRQHKQAQERREWLQTRLRGIHTAPARGGGEAGRTRKRLIPEDLSDLSDLTPEQIQHTLRLLEKFFDSKQS